MLAPDSAMLVGAVVVSVPPHTAADAFATVSPVGKVSVNATPSSGMGAFAAGLVMVKVSDVVAFRAIVAGLNALAIDGGTATPMQARAVRNPPFSFEVTGPVMLHWDPAAVKVTFTLKVQELFAGSVAPDKLMLPDPAVAVMAPPPQLPLSPFGVLTTCPAGSVSLKPTPVSVVV